MSKSRAQRAERRLLRESEARRWNLEHGTVPLPKANRLGHLEENLDVFDFEIGVDDLEALDALNERYSALGSLPYA